MKDPDNYFPLGPTILSFHHSCLFQKANRKRQVDVSTQNQHLPHFDSHSGTQMLLSAQLGRKEQKLPFPPLWAPLVQRLKLGTLSSSFYCERNRIFSHMYPAGGFFSF